jgi:hypothetical protein
MARKEASFNGGAPPPPPSGFFQGLLDSLPAVLLVLDAGGTIRFAAGQIHRLGDRAYNQLVGSKLGNFVVGGEERGLLEELLDVTSRKADGEMVGPIRLPYQDLDGTVRLTEVWALNRSQDSGTAGVVVIVLPESAYSRFDEALAAIVKEASLDETFDALAAGLRVSPVEAECFFVRRGRDDRGLVRTPGVAGVPGPPTPGPWEESTRTSPRSRPRCESWQNGRGLPRWRALPSITGSRAEPMPASWRGSVRKGTCRCSHVSPSTAPFSSRRSPCRIVRRTKG